MLDEYQLVSRQISIHIGNRKTLALRAKTVNGFPVLDRMRTRFFPRSGRNKTVGGNMVANFHGISFLKKTLPKREAFKVPDD